jgi:hypothetical protein
VDDVEAAALQRKSFVHKIVDRRSEIELAIEPWLYGVLIGGLDIFEMAGLKGTQMRVHDGRSQRRFAAVASHEREQTPAEEHGQEKRGSYGEPAPGSRISHRNNRGGAGSAKLLPQLFAQRYRGAFVQTGSLERSAQAFVRLESGDAIGAGNQVVLEIGGARGV